MMKKIVVSILLAVLLTGCGSPEEKSEKLYNDSVVSFEAGNVDRARVEAQNAIKLNPKSGKAYVVLARCAMKKQNWRGAFGAYSQAVQLDPSLIDAQLGLGRIYLLAKKYDEAEKVVVTILEKSPENKAAHLLRAAIFLQTESYGSAEVILRTLLQKDPQDAETKLGLATIYEKTGKLDKAIDTINEAINEHPDEINLYYKAASIAISMKRYDDAEKYYLQLADLVSGEKVVQPLLAQLYSVSEDNEKFLKIMGQLVNDNPQKVEYRISLAGFYMKEKNLDKALSVLQEADLEEADIRIDLATVEVLSAQEKLDEAETGLLAIIDKYHDNVLIKQAVLKLSLLYFQQGKYAETMATLEKVDQLSPEMFFVRAQARFATRDLDGAIADLRIVRKELPDNLRARQQLAQAYLVQDKGLMAVEELHDILNQDGTYSSSRDLLVSYYTRDKQWDFAEKELQKLIDQHPEDPKYLMAMGDIYRMQKNMEQAKKYYLTILKLPEGHGPAYLQLGFLAEQDGDTAGALAFYDKVLELHPQAVTAIERKLFLFSAQKDQTEFIAYRNELLEADAKSPVVYDILGRIAIKNGDSILAEKEFRASSKLAPEWSVPYQRMIQLYLLNNDIDKAIVQCNKVLDKNPDAVVENFLLGQIYQAKGDNDLAKEYYELLLDKKPEFLPAANNLAYLYAEEAQNKNDLNKALDLAKRAAKGRSPESLDTLGWVYHLLGNREQSMQALNQAYEARPKNKTIAYHLATVLVKWSYNFEAKNILEETLADGKDFPEKKAIEDMLAKL